MYILWLIFMALFIGWLAVPIARKAGYSYGRFGRVKDILIVVAGALVFGVLIVAGLSALGLWNGNETSALIIGFIGMLVTIFVMTVFSVKEAIAEEHIPNHGDTRSIR